MINHTDKYNTYWNKDYMVSAIGCGTDESINSLMHNQSGLIKAKIAGSDEERYIGHIDWSRINTSAPELTKLETLFVHCINKVIADEINLSSTGLIISSTKGNIDLLKDHDINDPRLSLFNMAKTIANVIGIKSNPIVISNACISGVSALIIASRLIQLGKYENIIVAGGDLLTHFVYSGFNSFKSLSADICRPYDKTRDGLSIGEACGAVLLSRHKLSDDDVIVGDGGISNDANHISGPSRTGDGLCFAINQAMERNNLTSDDLAFISAHGTATVYNDEMESKAITLAQLSDIPLNSTKAFTGHTLGACGIIESIISVWELKHDYLFATKGFNEIGTPHALNVHNEHINVNGNVGLKIASGFGGCNAALALSKKNIQSRLKDTNKSIKMISSFTIDGSKHPFAQYIRECYRSLNDPNLKFFKMDNLCKLGYIACEHLLKDVELPVDRTKIAIIIANSSSSLDTDLKHQNIINSKEDVSPAVFVYTLPNIVAGELCIRHKINGENTFFIQNEKDGFALEYAKMLMQYGYADMVIYGWCDFLVENYKADFKLMTII